MFLLTLLSLSQASSSFGQGLSFEQDLTGTSSAHFTDSANQDVSIGTYFQKKSHSLGGLQPVGSKLSPSKRVSSSTGGASKLGLLKFARLPVRE